MPQQLAAKKHQGKSTQIRIRRSRNKRKYFGGEGIVSFRRVIIEKKGRKKELLMALKSFRAPSQPVETQFNILNTLRKIPELKEHIPPTIRLVKHNRKKYLLLTDLTKNGRLYLIRGGATLVNYKLPREVQEKLFTLIKILLSNGFKAYYDAFEVEMKLKNKQLEFGNIWIVDCGCIFQKRT